MIRCKMLCFRTLLDCVLCVRVCVCALCVLVSVPFYSISIACMQNLMIIVSSGGVCIDISGFMINLQVD
jgi:hypothetical protein